MLCAQFTPLFLRITMKKTVFKEELWLVNGYVDYSWLVAKVMFLQKSVFDLILKDLVSYIDSVSYTGLFGLYDREDCEKTTKFKVLF